MANLNKLGITKDINFDLNGKLELVTASDKIKQAIIKALQTEIGANSLISDYGSSLSSIIGQKFDALAEFKIYNSIQQAVRFLINEQQLQNNLTLEETILAILKVGIVQDSSDPRIIRVTIDIRTGDFQRVKVGLGIINTP